VTVDGTAGLYSHETEQYVKADSHPICVEWKVFQGKSADSPLQWVVAKGKAYTTSDIDYTVKVRNFSRNRRIDMLSIRC
jgi:alkaline phosphatase D